MTARDAMLAAIRAARPEAVPRPDVRAAVAAFPAIVDLGGAFRAAAEAAAARVISGRRADAAALIASSFSGGGRHVSALDDTTVGSTRQLPHSFDDVELFVCEAELGVAENGAVWLPLSRLRHRSAVVLAQHVMVLLDRSRIVGNMHDAYTIIDVARDAFGAFVAGPSKTADIEQALVIGAHGPKSLTILMLD
ncbi:MAG: LUD domain-containing protein [bacterium]